MFVVSELCWDNGNGTGWAGHTNRNSNNNNTETRYLRFRRTMTWTFNPNNRARHRKLFNFLFAVSRMDLFGAKHQSKRVNNAQGEVGQRRWWRYGEDCSVSISNEMHKFDSFPNKQNKLKLSEDFRYSFSLSVKSDQCTEEKRRESATPQHTHTAFANLFENALW